MNQVLLIGGMVAGLFGLTFFVGEMSAKRRSTRHETAYEFEPDPLRDRAPTEEKTES